MTFPQQNLLCLYRYDPLDRMISHTQSQASPLQRFYCKSRLATEIQGALHHSIVQHDDLLLAQQQRQDDVLDTTILATDLQRSILQTLKANQQRHSIAYSPYGHRRPENGLLSLLGFNGERPDPVTGYYLLGNGYRAFNPVLMRFNSPDSWSPFGKGGLNSYAYCLGDPINLSDPSGHDVFSTVAALVHWKHFFAKAKHAAKLELESVKVTRTIEVFSWSPNRYPLKPGAIPETAIAARNYANKLDYLGSFNRFANEKFLSDLANESRAVAMLNEVLVMPPVVSRRLKALNYIKNGKKAKGQVYSSERLEHSIERPFSDPPRHIGAGEYKRELNSFAQARSSDLGERYREEAMRIRNLYFDLS